MKKILFILQGGSGGSEESLYNVLRYLNDEKFQFEIVATSAADLPEDLANNCKIHRLPSTQSRAKEVIGKILRNTVQLEYDHSVLKSVHAKFQPDLWYLNTGTFPDLAQLARDLSIPYIVHYHELESVFDQMKGKTMREMIEGAKVNIACSQPVLEMLKLFNNARTALFHEHIRTERIQAQAEQVHELRAELELDDFEFVWSMAGASSPRKGLDRFIELAQILPNHGFMWIGRQRDHGYNEIQKRKIESWGLKNVRLVDQQGEAYYNYLAMADGFFLSSREDPFPLVMLEAAFLEKPIIAVDSGGVSEFVSDGMGAVEAVYDPLTLSEKMKKIASGDLVISRDRLKESALKFDIRNGIQSWESIVDSL